MDFKQKLRQIESIHQKKHTLTRRQLTYESNESIEQLLGGATKKSQSGSVFYNEWDFPLNFRHGNAEIGSLLNSPASLLTLVGKDVGLRVADCRKILFIDTETSGLSGGAGTFAFLVGIGYFREHNFRLVQFFLNDLTDEHPLLHELNRIVHQYELVVSYNGKCFDVPILDSRNIYNRINSPLTQLPHLDLLHVVRRLWKHRLPDCALGSAEEGILGVRRVGDIPGFMIPHIYFHYLQTGNPEPLKPVFYHNQQDILSLVGLLSKIMRVFDNPVHECQSPIELLAVAKSHEALGRYEAAVALYENYISGNGGTNLPIEILFRLAFSYKKLGDCQNAARIWKTCLATKRYHPLPYIELAKHYEHKESDFQAAKDLVEQALKEMDILERLNRQDWLGYQDDLKYRHARLQKRVRPRQKDASV